MTEPRPNVWEPEEGADLMSAVHQAVGSASVAWVPKPAGVFDDVWARTVAEGLIAWLNEHYAPPAKEVSPNPWTPYMHDDGECGCWTCVNERAEKIADGYQRLTYLSRFIVCPECGNKRCPKGTWHENACTGSNDPQQPGSRYGGLE